MEKTRIAIVDDHNLVRSGLVSMLENLVEIEVTIEAENGKDFLNKIEHLKHPGIAIVDLHMPEMDGFELIEYLTQNHPAILCLALTFDDSNDALSRSIKLGARGFILKNSSSQEFEKAIKSILLTGYYHSDAIHNSMLSNPALKSRQEQKRDAVLEGITPREMEFLMNVCSPQELTYEMIADKMGVHRRTVDNFRASLFEKFQIKSKAGLVLFAFKWDLISEEKT